MSRMLAAKLFLLSCTALISIAGCANRQGWGFSSGQGTIERQKSRAAAVDPYPLNDIGPEVLGGRPRDFMNPMPEPERAFDGRLPSSFGYGP